MRKFSFHDSKTNLRVLGSFSKSFLFYKFSIHFVQLDPHNKEKLDQALEYSGHRSTKVLHCRQSCPFGPPSSHSLQKGNEAKKKKTNLKVPWPSSLEIFWRKYRHIFVLVSPERGALGMKGKKKNFMAAKSIMRNIKPPPSIMPLFTHAKIMAGSPRGHNFIVRGASPKKELHK